MPYVIRRFFNLLASTVALATLGWGSAHAGLVTGNWDPQFGPDLPNLSYQVRVEALVPNACSNQVDGIYSTVGGACDNSNPADSKFLGVWLRLFNTGLADPNNFFGLSANSTYFSWCDDSMIGDPRCNNFSPNYFTASSIRVAQEQIVGFDTDSQFGLTYSCNFPCSFPDDYFSSPASAEGNLFELSLAANGPLVTCLNCKTTLFDFSEDLPNVPASTADLTQFIVTYEDNVGQTPKFTDSQGNALGARLSSDGTYLGRSTSATTNSVPEPGSMLLVLAALGGLVTTVRRRRID